MAATDSYEYQTYMLKNKFFLRYLLKTLPSFEKHYLMAASEWFLYQQVSKKQPLKDVSEGQDDYL